MSAPVRPESLGVSLGGPPGRTVGPAPLRPTDPPAIGPYRLLGRLGSGGMGTVYLAESPRGPEGQHGAVKVAIKVIRPEYADDPVFRGRFRRETQAAELVRGPGVAAVLDADADAPLPYLVMEYVPGPSLRDHVQASGPLREAALDAFAAGVARALTVIHGAGVVHRDLKPANVLLAPGGPCVVDFGIARPSDAATAFTTTGEVVGSIGWMAPEVLRQQPAGPPADVFGWGALVAYAGTGRRPFGEGPDAAVAHRVLAGPPPDVAGLPPRLAAAVGAALQPDPAARPRAVDLAEALTRGLPLRPVVPDPTRAFTVPDPTRAAAPPPRAQLPAGPPAPRRRRRRVLLAGGAVAAAALAVAAAPRHDPSTALTAPRTTVPPAKAKATTKPSPEPSPKPSTRPTPRPSPTAQPTPDGSGYLLAAAVPPAREGDVVFRLTELRCGRTTVGQGDLAYDVAPGRRACTALVVVRNTGRRPHLLPQQWLHGPGGQGFGSNLLLTPALGRPPLEFHTLHPGEVLRSGLVWELPAGVRPVDVELHADLVSPGVRRRLR